jgi:hypothetical protein
VIRFAAGEGTGAERDFQVHGESPSSHLDLPSLYVGHPTPASGFVDLDMKIIGQLKEAGFITAHQPRCKNEEGKRELTGRLTCRII